MKKLILIFIGAIFLISLISATGYTAPSYTNVTIVLDQTYTAPLYTNVTIVLGAVTGGGPTDTCTYTSGNWNMNCQDNCTITSNVNLNHNNLTINGTGNIILKANITNYGILVTAGVSSANPCSVYCLGGNCFQT